MKKNFELTFLFILFFNNSFSQEVDCKVLLPNISEKYIGKCKNGLAHGKGIAFGIDTFKGNFTNGLPNGKGIYIWKDNITYTGRWKNGRMHGKGKLNFNKDSVLIGYWQNGEFLKSEITKSPQAFSIIKNKNIDRCRIVKTGNGNQILIKLQEFSGQRPYDFFSVSVDGGNYYKMGNNIGIDITNLPVEVNIKFAAPSKLKTVNYTYEIVFKINEFGNWEVTISY